ncbi:MAG: hypothetical protein ABR530_06225 [Pyrinomonadaceae bacterium]
MGIKGFITRALPFIATFAIGIIIASFFVTVSSPGFGQRGGRWRKHQEMKRLRVENEELRNENLRLKNELESHRLSHPRAITLEHEELSPAQLDELVPPPPIPAAAPPVRGHHR